MQIEYYNMENLHLYINDENNREIICGIVDAMRDVADNYHRGVYMQKIGISESIPLMPCLF